MITSSDIRTFDLVENPYPVGAVDGANVEVVTGQVMTHVTLAVHYSHNQEALPHPYRVTGYDNEAFSQLARYIRMFSELELLAKTEEPVIADGSWWSFLMDTNKFLTTYYNAIENGDDVSVFTPLHDALTQSVFLQAISNPNIIAMSKRGTSSYWCNLNTYKEYFSQPVSDLALFTKILQEGEYTRPVGLKATTDSSFGIEKRGWSEDTRNKINKRYTDRNGLHVFFYRPWNFKRAYRIECGYEVIQNGYIFEIMSSIRQQTQYPGIVEPYAQLMADRLAKQVSALSRLYGEINMSDYQSIMYLTRT